MWVARIIAILCCAILVADAEGESEECPCRRPELNGQLVKHPHSTSVYLVVDGSRRGIPNPTTFNNLFRDWNSITITDVDTIPLGSPSGLTDGAILANVAGNDAIYLISNGVKRLIPNPAIFETFHFNAAKIVTLPKVVVDSIPNGKHLQGPLAKMSCNCPRNDLNGQLVKSKDSVAVFLVLDGIRRGIPNEQTYNNLFRDWSDIKIINVNEIPLGSNLSDGASLVKSPTNTSVYLVSNGVKRGITSGQAFKKYHFGWDKIIVVPQIAVDFIPNGKSIS